MISIINYYLTKNRINKIDLPKFKESQFVRKRYTFIGKVKRVGFRNETLLIARYVGVVGFVYNTRIGVVAEVEGTLEQINYVLSHLISITRFTIEKISEEEVPLVSEKRYYKK